MGSVVAAVAVVGIERVAEHLERLEPIVAVGVEDGGDQPSGQPLHEEAVKLRVVGIPIFLVLLGGIDVELVGDGVER